MSYAENADRLIDRRRLRRKLSFWRVAAFLAVVAAIAIAGYRFGRGEGAVGGAHIARVDISGVITGDRETLRLLERVRESNASAVLLTIESPGGTTTGAERLYDEIRRLAEKKPVVAVVGSMAASGAYIAALGTDRIVARGNSLVGSIGVLMQFPNVSKLLDTVGVKVESIKSSPLKAAPNGLEPTSPEAREAMAAIVADTQTWFRNLVRDRRNMTEQEVTVVADGRVFTARQGVPLKLVDEIGGEREAIAWLEKEKNVPKNLRVRDWRRTGGGVFGGYFASASQVAHALGLEGLSRALGRADAFAEAQLLDGLVAVWHGPGWN